MNARYAVLLLGAVSAFAAAPYHPTTAERALIQSRLDRLSRALKDVHAPDDLVVDAAVYEKAARWILRFDDEFYAQAYVANTVAALDRGLERAQDLARGKAPWAHRKGRLARAYRSHVDGSIQPYGLVIPESYDGSHPVRLDVVLHGRGSALNEVSFLAAHDSPNPVPAGQDFIQLDVFGRGNNAYRWSGETDVFEALDSVTRRYRIDPDRIVLRGFSMGGAGAWHIGLHYPDRWAAFEAGAGFVETRVYARIPELPPWQDAAVHIYDALDYAANAFDVPLVGYGGEIDPQLAASRAIREELEGLGYQFLHEGWEWRALDPLRALFLVGPGTPHRFHPDSKRLSDEFLNRAAAAGRGVPDRIRFVTWTARYNRCFWVTVDELARQYRRAEVDAERDAREVRVKTSNVARLSLDDVAGRAVSIDGTRLPAAACFEHRAGAWSACRPERGLHKRHGLQGPIDDAFLGPFLCVRPTGKPRDAAVNAYVLRALERFEHEYARFFRADVPVKDDRAVTAADIAGRNLILFGDPGSNRLLARMARRLPLRWGRGTMPVLIYPNPLNPRRYVVVNSGHTFHEKELLGTNALLFPRLGDHAVIRVSDGTVLDAGMFDADWK